MDTHDTNLEIEAWLEGLAGKESKRHESIARAIAKKTTYDKRVIAALQQIALSDPMPYAREAAVQALHAIAGAHFAAGNEIRVYLEKLRSGKVRTQPLPVTAPNPDRAVPPASIATAPTPHAVEPSPIETVPARIEESNPQASLHTEPLAPMPAAKTAVSPVPREPAAPPKPAVPFDQWLLSERNIKLALYSGGFLLLLAGLIFVGVNWVYLPGIAKLAVTLAVTLGMYLGGAFLSRRPTLKIGGTALLAIASGFLPLNFAVTQIYITRDLGVSTDAMWLAGSLACGLVYFLTAVRTRSNVFTLFLVGAIVSVVSAAASLSRVDVQVRVVGYALMTLGILGAAYAVKTQSATQFMARTLRLAGHFIAPWIFFMAFGVWAFSLADSWYGETGTLYGVAMAMLVVFYVLEDWRGHLNYARWCAALAFGILLAMVGIELKLSSIQTGLVLKGTAALYFMLGKYLSRNRKWTEGLPLYTVGALLALFVTLPAMLDLQGAPGHLVLALVGDVALLWLATYLSRRIEFAFGAVWLLLAPVYLYCVTYLVHTREVAVPIVGTFQFTPELQAGLTLAGLLAVYATIGYRLASSRSGQALRSRRELPFLSAAAFLSLWVPAFLVSATGVLTLVLLLIAFGYAALALRLRVPSLLFGALAAVNFALVGGSRIFVAGEIPLMRVVAFAFCGWAVLLVLGRRALLYLRYARWALPLEWGARINFGLVYALTFILAFQAASEDMLSFPLALTLLCGVALLLLTAYLYRRSEFVYAAILLFIAPFWLFAQLTPADPVRVGLGMGGLMLVYVAAAFFIGQNRSAAGRIPGLAVAFLAAAALLSVIAPWILFPDYAILTGMLVCVALLYGLVAVRWQWRWLVLAGALALHLALWSGLFGVFKTGLQVQQGGTLGMAALGIAFLAAAVELKRRGYARWRMPLYLVVATDLLLAYLLALASSDGLVVAVSLVVAPVCFAVQWVERYALPHGKFPPVLSYLGALVTLNGVYFAVRVLGLPVEFVPAAIASGSAILVLGALVLRGGAEGNELHSLYGAPLRYVGYGLTGVALVASLVAGKAGGTATAFAIAGIAVGADGLVRKQMHLLYASVGAFAVAWVTFLRFLGVTELQAYTVPVGAALLLIGWSEGRRGNVLWYRMATVVGWGIVLGSAFYQSLSQINYAGLLLLESIIACGLGIRMRSRSYVEVGILALVANGIAQFGPALVELPRWVQIGSIGSILVLSGLVALLRRQALLEARRTLTGQWRTWKP